MASRLVVGDEVVVISGKNKGKTGSIKEILREEDKVIVAGLNLVKRHTKPSPKNQSGGIIEKEAPMHACKVMPIDPETGKPTRVRFRMESATEGGSDKKTKKVRVAKSGATIVVK